MKSVKNYKVDFEYSKLNETEKKNIISYLYAIDAKVIFLDNTKLVTKIQTKTE